MGDRYCHLHDDNFNFPGQQRKVSREQGCQQIHSGLANVFKLVEKKYK